MTEELKPETIKSTQNSLGKFIKKPPLTDKLLKKPPFRFLHDVVTSVIKETGFLSGLYSISELQSENIKDRDMKIAFLQKLIDCIKLVTEKNIEARPSKIVAGLEPSKTNELLQLLGYALSKKLDSTAAVAQLQGGAAPPKAKDDKKATKKVKDKTESKPKQSPSTTSTPRSKISKPEKVPSVSSRTKDSPRTKTDSVKKEKTVKKEAKVKKDASPRIKDSPKDSKRDKNKIESPKVEQIETPVQEPLPQEQTITDAHPVDVKDVTIPQEPQPVEVPEAPEPEIKEKLLEIPKKTKREPVIPIHPIVNPEPELLMSKEPPKSEGFMRPKTSLRPPSVRPSSARPGAPRLKDKNEIILPQDELVSMGKVNVIVENFSLPDDEDDNEETVVVESVPELVFEAPPPKSELPAEKGHLVAQILEQIGDSESLGPEVGKPRVEIEWDRGGARNREIANREMEKLRDSIQTLTRAANPLGKLMNFLQEDVDSMRSELQMWIEVDSKLTAEIKIQERTNDESIEPLKEQLRRLEDDISKQHEHIFVTQANILRNEQKIKMLLVRDG